MCCSNYLHFIRIFIIFIKCSLNITFMSFHPFQKVRNGILLFKYIYIYICCSIYLHFIRISYFSLFFINYPLMSFHPFQKVRNGILLFKINIYIYVRCSIYLHFIIIFIIFDHCIINYQLMSFHPFQKVRNGILLFTHSFCLLNFTIFINYSLISFLPLVL